MQPLPPVTSLMHYSTLRGWQGNSGRDAEWSGLDNSLTLGELCGGCNNVLARISMYLLYDAGDRQKIGVTGSGAQDDDLCVKYQLP